MNGQAKNQIESKSVQNAKVPILIDSEKKERPPQAQMINYAQMVFECKTCGIKFKSGKAYKSRVPAYCSSKCYGISLIKRKVCAHCGNIFHNANKKYCSSDCAHAARRGIPLSDKHKDALREGRKKARGRIKPKESALFICHVCGIKFPAANYEKDRTYCSRSCYWEAKNGRKAWNKGLKMWVDTPHPRGTLGMKFPNRKPLSDEQRRRMSLSQRGKKHPEHSGQNHHWWKGGVTSENEKVRKSSDYANWRISVFERDAYACQDCHDKGVYFHAHHIKSFSENPDLRFDIDNGVTLCIDCHAKRHDTVFSIKALNNCQDCGKRIKVGAKRCRPCQIIFTQSNRKKCIDCGAVIQRVSIRCRSCAAKINIVKTQNYKSLNNLRGSHELQNRTAAYQ